MAIPDYQTLMRPVLEVAAQQYEWPIRDLVEAVAPVVGVSAADRTETISSGMGLWENRRAVVQVTDRGRQLLASGSAVDNRTLEQFEEFRAFRTRVRPSPAAPATPAADLSPYDLLEQARQDAESVLVQELLDRLRQGAAGPLRTHRAAVAVRDELRHGRRH